MRLSVRRNRAEFVGHASPLVIDLLNVLEESALGTSFRVVGTHALYAYEARAAVRLDDDTLATNDVDLAFNMDHALQLVSTLERMNTSFLGVLQRADKTFRLRADQKYTAVNSQGFEVDLLRRMATSSDKHPFNPSGQDEDFYFVQARWASKLLACEPFSEIITSTRGTMARMNTVHPQRFAEIKRATAALAGREPGKAARDLKQAEAVELMIEQGYLPTLSPAEPEDLSSTDQQF